VETEAPAAVEETVFAPGVRALLVKEIMVALAALTRGNTAVVAAALAQLAVPEGQLAQAGLVQRLLYPVLQ